ncbi:MAG: Gfo/Idh/MocA family oxidoreductase [Saprospiraceae bacterium]|nr:Gfo/Idh/MocA family oxidoreductase [Saprospiraceae bacterium]MCB9320674.1 Gfo/Idh/MocA family oxidoreductase [Lewinellaceae bacterium]
MKPHTRRSFIKTTATGGVTILAGGILPGMQASSYRRILGANDRINAAIMGVNSRGTALATNFARQADCTLTHICDVDSRAITACTAEVIKRQDSTPKGEGDFRRVLENPDVDVMIIAAPDHWHAPAALLAMQAGKNVYVEKPCSHNPAEGEMLVKAASMYKKVVQMGNQRRSWPNVMAGIKALHDGEIGRPYLGKGWYTNNRGPIGVGQETAVPEWLNWELWQGPAPRKAFKDNYVHYNWHWFWHWGTGEALNNGTHMIDLLRWGFQVEFPVRVSSNGGRFRYQDDWQTPDTQIISLDFPEGLTMTWEGRSCNGKFVEGSSVGVQFYAEGGTLLIPGGNSYTLFDLDNNIIREVKDTGSINPLDKANPAEQLDALHIRNFFDAIRDGKQLASDIDSGHKSTLLVQLGNIAQRVGHSLDIDPASGRILNSPEAMQYWSREYEPGWEMKV